MCAMLLVVGVMLAIGVACEIRSWKNWGRDIEWAEEAIDRARMGALEDEDEDEEGDGCEIEEDDEYDRKLFGGGK